MNWLALFILLALGVLIEAQYSINQPGYNIQFGQGQYRNPYANYNPYAGLNTQAIYGGNLGYNIGYGSGNRQYSSFPSVPAVPQYQAPQYRAPQKTYSAPTPTYNTNNQVNYGLNSHKPKLSFGEALAAHNKAVQAQQALISTFTKNYGLDLPYQYQQNNKPSAPQGNAASTQYSGPVNVAPKKVYNPAEVHYANIDPSLQGNYKFGYHTGGKQDNSFREEVRLKDGTVQGAYGYVDASGRTRVVKYSAGAHGFQILGEGQKHEAPTRTYQASAPAPAQNINVAPTPGFGLNSQSTGPKLSYTEGLALHARQLAAQKATVAKFAHNHGLLSAA